MRTKRQTFNKIKKHLLEQGEPAQTKHGLCAYHSKDGLKCAVGCLISDDDYKPSFEQKSVFDLKRKLGTKKLEKILNTKIDDQSLEMLFELQHIHDEVLPFGWKKNLNNLEKKWFGVTKKK